MISGGYQERISRRSVEELASVMGGSKSHLSLVENDKHPLALGFMSRILFASFPSAPIMQKSAFPLPFDAESPIETAGPFRSGSYRLFQDIHGSIDREMVLGPGNGGV